MGGASTCVTPSTHNLIARRKSHPHDLEFKRDQISVMCPDLRLQPTPALVFAAAVVSCPGTSCPATERPALDWFEETTVWRVCSGGQPEFDRFEWGSSGHQGPRMINGRYRDCVSGGLSAGNGVVHLNPRFRDGSSRSIIMDAYSSCDEGGEDLCHAIIRRFRFHQRPSTGHVRRRH